MKSATEAARTAEKEVRTRVPDGAFTSWLHESLREGDTLDVMTPHGSFTTGFVFDISGGRATY